MKHLSDNQVYVPSTVEECIHVVDFIGGVTLCSGHADSGPFVIRVGKVPVATFGMDLTPPRDQKPDPNQELLQTQAAKIALLAFKLVRQRISTAANDPSQLREMVRSVCKHARLSFLASHRQQTAKSNNHSGMHNSYASHKPGLAPAIPSRVRSVHYRPYP